MLQMREYHNQQPQNKLDKCTYQERRCKKWVQMSPKHIHMNPTYTQTIQKGAQFTTVLKANDQAHQDKNELHSRV